MLFRITSSKGEVLSTNLPSNCQNCPETCSAISEKTTCPQSNEPRRRGMKKDGDWLTYTCTDDINSIKSKKVFIRESEVVAGSIPFLIKLKNEVEEMEKTAAKRLMHNITSLNALCLQEVFAFISQDLFSGTNQFEQMSITKKIIEENPADAAKLLLRVIKNNSFMKAEISVFEKLYDASPRLKKKSHIVHKVITNVLYIFFAELTDRQIKMHIADCLERVVIDYDSITVALIHLIDNAAKYALSESSIFIDFKKNENLLIISVDMISIQIKDHEANRIYEENYSGSYVRSLALSGNGIGMYIVKRLIDLNGGSINLIRNTDPQRNDTRLGIPYERNIFEISLPCTSTI
jgi:signal transduction histidine kinase